MGDALYRFFLSIGVGLGLIAGQADPQIAGRILRQEAPPGSARETLLVAEAEIAGAFSKGSRELVEAGSTIAVRLAAELVASGGRSWRVEATRSLAFDLRARRYVVGFAGEGRTASVPDAETAIALASSFPGFAICPASNLAYGGRVTLSASVGLVDAAGAWHDAPVLWNYVRPQAGFSFGSPTEVPF
jgi:hypothetical protein